MLREGPESRSVGPGFRLIVKQLKPVLHKVFLLGRSFSTWAARYFVLFIKLLIQQGLKAWKWLDKPHTIRIKKKTIIIGCLILVLLYNLLVPGPQKIVYAGGNNTPPSPIKVVIPKKIATLPQTDLQPVSEAQPVQVAPISTPSPNAQSSTVNLPNSVVLGCGDNAYANYIYMHESGCSTTITNYLGCVGIGQACPGSKLYAVCPNLDYACENSFFTAYAGKYGGWAGAYAFWLANHWW